MLPFATMRNTGEGASAATGPDTRRTRTLAGIPVEDDRPPRAGDVIAGRYRIDRVLGAGGMGVVFSGLHLDLAQPVAVKLILPSAMNNKELRERFLREARAAARLKSEHVTKVLDVGQLESGAPYMVMELLEGCDLAAFLAQNGRVSPRTAADFIAQACEAVAEAHALGIVHRDLKPQNLFLTTCVGGDALIKVLDFGVSKVSIADVESLTKSMVVMGSPLYISPEQMRSSRSVDRRTDIWALGVVLFELLAGHAPFDGESIPALCLKVATDAPPSLALERPDLRPGLAAVVMRCLEKQPEKRYDDVGELAAALSPFVGSASSVSIARTRMMASGARGRWPRRRQSS
jgi:serine/threonine-protein kinase